MITTNAELEQFLSEIDREDILAVDTEFLRVDTFYPRPCVLQLASRTKHQAIDLLSDIDLSLIKTVLYNKTLVFHSARQDLEVLYHLFGSLPHTIFDTQILAHFLGFTRQISYADLVAAMLGITIEKAYSQYDWSIRPLPQEVLKYALEDVIYLIQIYDKCRYVSFYEYVAQDAQLLLDSSLYMLNLEHSYTYLKGRGHLNEDALNLAARICAYRELQASSKNIPRKWVLSDEKILNMVMHQCVPEEIWEQLPTLPHIKTHHYSPPTQTERNAVKQLQKHFTVVATEYNLPVELLATNKEILAYLRGNTRVRFCAGWRWQLLDALQIKILRDCCNTL